MINIRIDKEQLEALAAKMKAFSERRIAATLATAMSRTAVKVREEMKREIARSIDNPTPYTLRGVFMRGATAQRLVARVWYQDEPVGNQVPTVRYLYPQLAGGGRGLKRFEKALQANGVMPKGWQAVPAKATRLDAYGNVTRGEISRILSQIGTEMTSGYRRSLTKGKDKKSKTKQRRAYGKAGGQYVAVTDRKGKLAPGIYLAEARDFGSAWGLGRTGRLTPVMFYVKATNYTPRIRFEASGTKAVNDNLMPEIKRSIEEQIARLNARSR